MPVAAARIGIAVGTGIAIGRLIGLTHGYWVGLSTAAVLQATNITLARRRALHRAGGTAIGVLLAALVLSTDPGTVATVAVIAALQLMTELVIGAHYGLAVVLLTSLPLLLIHAAGAPESGAQLVGARLLDTVIGCALALLAGTLLWRGAAGNRLPGAQAAALDQVRRLLVESYRRDVAADALHRARREVRSALVTLRGVQRDALGDAGQGSDDADRRWPVTLAVERLAYVALSAPVGRIAVDPAALGQLDRAVAALADGVRAGSVSDGAPPLALQELPHTTAQLDALRRELSSAYGR